MLEKYHKNAKITLSILFIFAGIGLISYTYFDSIKSNVYNEMNIRYLEQQIVLSEPLEEIVVENTTQVTEVVTTTKVTVDSKDNYIGYLEVPDVNIKKGFVSLDSK